MKKFSVAEFQAKFGVSIPLHVQEPSSQRWVTEKYLVFFERRKLLIQKGDVLKAVGIQVEVCPQGGSFDIHVLYRKVGGTFALITPISSFPTKYPGSEEHGVCFSDRHIRQKLESELGKLPPSKGNFVCTCCAINTGDQESCSGCSAPSYWVPGGGGVSYGGEMTYEFE